MRYLITWTCYGSHLPGDSRGKVDRDHNVPGSRLAPADPRKADDALWSMRGAPYLLNEHRRNLVLNGIQDACNRRSWNLLAAHVRTNHVHAVVEAEQPPEAILQSLKAYATRALNRVEPKQERWTRHGALCGFGQTSQSAMQFDT